MREHANAIQGKGRSTLRPRSPARSLEYQTRTSSVPSRRELRPESPPQSLPEALRAKMARYPAIDCRVQPKCAAVKYTDGPTALGDWWTPTYVHHIPPSRLLTPFTDASPRVSGLTSIHGADSASPWRHARAPEVRPRFRAWFAPRIPRGALRRRLGGESAGAVPAFRGRREIKTQVARTRARDAARIGGGLGRGTGSAKVSRKPSRW